LPFKILESDYFFQLQFERYLQRIQKIAAKLGGYHKANALQEKQGTTA
jgi:hypothetical protein